MIGLALSGGGSRAMAFHLGCLRALNDLELLDKVGVLSTISGGSVIGAYYAYSPGKSFEEFEADIRRFLRNGFHRKIAMELLKPKNLLPGMVACFCAHAQDGLGLITKREPKIPRFPLTTAMLSNSVLRIGMFFPGLGMTSPKRESLDIVVGACELRAGTAFRFGSVRSGSWRHGELIGNNIPLSALPLPHVGCPPDLPPCL